MVKQRLVLCRSANGFNDIINEIMRCLDYAIRYDRQLIIDTTHSGFLSCFSNYFTETELIHYGVVNDKSLTCSPHSLQGRLGTYDVEWIASINRYVDTIHKVPVTFDFSTPNDADVVIHQQGHGGGIDGTNFLRIVQFKPYLAAKISQILDTIKDYTAIHVRNTDLQTNYKQWFEELKPTISGQVIVCTDDLKCRNYAQTVWGDDLTIVTHLPDVNGANLHGNPHLNRAETNVNTLVDLALLSNGTTLYTTCVSTEGMGQHYTSGYGRLARMMHNDESILDNLLGK